MDTVRISLEFDKSIFSALRQDPSGFAREMRLAAAAKWYELGLISQAKAAEIAGLSRVEFLMALQRFSVTPFQYTPDEVVQEVERA